MSSKFDTTVGKDYWMTSGRLACGFNMPPAVKRTTLELHGLPPYKARKSFLVDEWPACPPDWMRSAGKLTSYFVPIQAGAGMWLDFNENNGHQNHVAIVVSVQGINAVTGLPCNDPALEQYIESCPKHKKAFGPNRFCQDCNYKWPKQNYLTSTGTPHGQLWLDGFRAADGAVRQYILTAEKARGVAKAIVGEQRVFAIGISFFLSKDLRPAQPVARRSLGVFGTKGIGGQSMQEHSVEQYCCNDVSWTANAESASIVSDFVSDSASMDAKISFKPRATSGLKKSLSANVPQYSAMRGRQITSSVNMVSVQKLEVAAGEKISQHVYDDPNDLSFWRTEPESILVINYALEADVEAILEAGSVDVDGSDEGFLQKVPVGN